MAKFGPEPSHDQSLIGELKYDERNAYGCGKFNSKLKSDLNTKTIIIVKRGNCSYVTKVRNIQKVDAELAIIIDEKDWEDPNENYMDDDLTGDDITIPSILIGYTDGNVLIRKVKELKSQGTPFKLLTSFYHTKSNIVKYELFLNSPPTSEFQFLWSFKDYYEKLGKKAIIIPRYFSTTWEDYGNRSFREKNESCICNGKYCGITPFHGLDIIMENLRQK